MPTNMPAEDSCTYVDAAILLEDHPGFRNRLTVPRRSWQRQGEGSGLVEEVD